MSDDVEADDVWRMMATLVFENRDNWRRTVVDEIGLPFSRIRILRRLAARPMTAGELAAMAAMDAPATSVAVSDLEERGLVVRELDPSNRRRKVVSLTESGHAVVASINKLNDPAPAPFATLSDAELRSLRELLVKMTAH